MNKTLDVKIGTVANTQDDVLVWNGKEWCKMSSYSVDYEKNLDDIPIYEIEKYLRKKKLENIKKIK